VPFKFVPAAPASNVTLDIRGLLCVLFDFETQSDGSVIVLLQLGILALSPVPLTEVMLTVTTALLAYTFWALAPCPFRLITCAMDFVVVDPAQTLPRASDGVSTYGLKPSPSVSRLSAHTIVAAISAKTTASDIAILNLFFISFFLSKEKKQNSIKKLERTVKFRFSPPQSQFLDQRLVVHIDRQQRTDQHGEEQERINDQEIGVVQGFPSVSAFHFCLLGLAHANS
jgi:hypothetical protein